MLALVQTTELLTALRDAGERMASAATEAGMAAEVPSCPGWSVRELLFHTGSVHRWATAIVGEGRSKPVAVAGGDPIQDAEHRPPDDKLVSWFAEGHAELLRTLQAAPPDLDCWSFLRAPSPVAFWVRRQTHETTVHRVDAELAVGAVTSVPADVAVDGIDELVTGFVTRRRGKLRSEQPRTLAVQATDRPAGWRLTISADPVVAERVAEVEQADATLRGPASQLYLALWNRLPFSAVDASGDVDLLKSWTTSVRIGWS